MKYYLIAGEASGDLHASNLMKSIKRNDAEASFRGFGGERMQTEGLQLVKHYKELAFIGFWEVLKHLRTILRNIKLCKQDILDFQPDTVILVDYPGFNLRIASFLKEQGIKVIYYISPQVWAWHASRVKKIQKVVDRMLVILPFEKDFYAQYGMDVDFVGHPLLDAMEQFPFNKNMHKDYRLDERPLIALLPGSRTGEIQSMLPVFVSLSNQFPQYQFAVAGLSQHGESFYREITGDSTVKIVIDETYSLLNIAYAAIVTSGTATLETALLDVPQVVAYKGGWLNYLIGSYVVNVDYISLVNIVMDEPVLQELIQEELDEGNLKLAFEKLLKEGNRDRFKEKYAELRKKLGGTGASVRAAEIIQQEVQRNENNV
ncbi:MAG: lipid-A-disaccharide synthase [Chitinophagales bacterium]